jgi:hypothetical protein
VSRSQKKIREEWEANVFAGAEVTAKGWPTTAKPYSALLQTWWSTIELDNRSCLFTGGGGVLLAILTGHALHAKYAPKTLSVAHLITPLHDCVLSKFPSPP